MCAEIAPVRRVAAYAVCRDGDRVLLLRESSRSGTPGVWTLPGGAVWHGEHPESAVVRESVDEVGAQVRPDGLIDVVADTRVVPARGVTIHTDRVLYGAAAPVSIAERPPSPSIDEARWVSEDEAATMPLRPFVANALKLPLSAMDQPPEEIPDVPSFHIVEAPDGRPHVQRFAAYGLVRNERGDVLLTRIADSFPGAGKWHLPGGGTDFGEQPADALLRELAEETGYAGEITLLLGVGSRHEPDQVGPEGFPIDWHGVRALYEVLVSRNDLPDPAVPTEVGGSTSEARWFASDELSRLAVTEVTTQAAALAE
jgi:8-oxo-dGTP diphosphatase